MRCRIFKPRASILPSKSKMAVIIVLFTGDPLDRTCFPCKNFVRLLSVIPFTAAKTLYAKAENVSVYTLASYVLVLLLHCAIVHCMFDCNLTQVVCFLQIPAMFLRTSDCWMLKIAKSAWLMPIRADIVTVNAHCHNAAT